MSESIIWDTLIKCQDEILGIFDEYADEIEEKGLNKFNQPENGWINRKKMRSIIFDDVSKKEMLEEIIHPKVSQEIFKAINQSNEHYLIISVPLLIETGMIQMMDRTLLVDCSETTQIERLMKRDEITLDAARSIIANQALRSDRQRFADDLILNEKNVTLKELEEQVLELHKRYSEL